MRIMNKSLENIREEVGWHIGLLCIDSGKCLDQFCMCNGETGYVYCATIDGRTITGVIDPYNTMEGLAIDIWDDINDHIFK